MKLLFLILLPLNLLAQNLQWDANDEPDLAGYRIYAGANSGDYALLQEVGRITKFALTFKDGLGRFFVVAAYDNNGNESSYSNEVFWKAPEIEPAPPVPIEWGLDDPIYFIVEYDHLDTQGNPLEQAVELQAGLGAFSSMPYTMSGDTLKCSLTGHSIGEHLNFRARMVNANDRSKSSEWVYTPETIIVIQRPQDLGGYPRPIRIFRLILK